MTGAAPAGAPGSDGPWPAIDGIDIPDARQRLMGERRLFAALLGSILEHYTPLAQAAQSWPADGTAAADACTAMHKLRGSAGMVGAQDLHHAAAAAEQALQDHDDAGYALAMQRVRDQLARLQRSWAAHAAELAAPASADIASAIHPMPSSSLPSSLPAAVDHLLLLLQQRRLGANSVFEALQPALGDWLGTEQLAQLQQHLWTLRYADAFALLSAARPAAAVKA